MTSENPGDDIGEDFSIAGTVEEEATLVDLQTWFREADEETIRLQGDTLFSQAVPDLGGREREVILIGLLKNDAAVRTATGSSLRDATYRFDVARCLGVLQQQRIAKRALSTEGGHPGAPTEVEVLATLPAGPAPGQLSGTRIRPLAPRLRRILLEAQESLRLANPYFDPDQKIIDDIMGLPRKGVDTRVLTREIDQPDHRQVFNWMAQELDRDALGRLDIRELYELDTTGRQAAATHAKLMVVDDTVAYVGSANLTVTSLGSNFEVGVLISGPPVADIATVFDQVFGTAREVDLPIQ